MTKRISGFSRKTGLENIPSSACFSNRYIILYKVKFLFCNYRNGVKIILIGLHNSFFYSSRDFCSKAFNGLLFN